MAQTPELGFTVRPYGQNVELSLQVESNRLNVALDDVETKDNLSRAMDLGLMQQDGPDTSTFTFPASQLEESIGTNSPALPKVLEALGGVYGENPEIPLVHLRAGIKPSIAQFRFLEAGLKLPCHSFGDRHLMDVSRQNMWAVAKVLALCSNNRSMRGCDVSIAEDRLSLEVPPFGSASMETAPGSFTRHGGRAVALVETRGGMHLNTSLLLALAGVSSLAKMIAKESTSSKLYPLGER